MKPLLVITTFPDANTARQIGTKLVEQQLAACINILPAIESIYIWENKTHQDPETLAYLKTTTEAYPKLEATLLEAHPYETPEIIALPIEKGSPAYLQWITDQTRTAESP